MGYSLEIGAPDNARAHKPLLLHCDLWPGVRFKRRVPPRDGKPLGRTLRLKRIAISLGRRQILVKFVD